MLNEVSYVKKIPACNFVRKIITIVSVAFLTDGYSAMTNDFLRDSFFNYDDELDASACPPGTEGCREAGKGSMPIRQGCSGIEQHSHGKDSHEVISTQVRDTQSSC